MPKQVKRRKQPVQQVEVPKAQSKLPSLTLVIAIAGLVISVTNLILDGPAKLNSFVTAGPSALRSVTDFLFVDKEYTGIWTSSLEGWVDATDEELKSSGTPGGPVTLSMRVYNGQVLDGQIGSEALEKNYISSAIQLEGQKNNGGLDLVAFDYVGGKKTALARFRVTLGDGTQRLPMRLETTEQGASFFPQTANLYRSDEDVSKGIPAELKVDLLTRVIEESRRAREDSQKR